jgi:hypothetical protein
MSDDEELDRIVGGHILPELVERQGLGHDGRQLVGLQEPSLQDLDLRWPGVDFMNQFQL